MRGWFSGKSVKRSEVVIGGSCQLKLVPTNVGEELRSYWGRIFSVSFCDTKVLSLLGGMGGSLRALRMAESGTILLTRGVPRWLARRPRIVGSMMQTTAEIDIGTIISNGKWISSDRLFKGECLHNLALRSPTPFMYEVLWANRDPTIPKRFRDANTHMIGFP